MHHFAQEPPTNVIHMYSPTIYHCLDIIHIFSVLRVIVISNLPDHLLYIIVRQLLPYFIQRYERDQGRLLPNLLDQSQGRLPRARNEKK